MCNAYWSAVWIHYPPSLFRAAVWWYVRHHYAHTYWRHAYAVLTRHPHRTFCALSRKIMPL
jgi:hypothetical protein